MKNSFIILCFFVFVASGQIRLTGKVLDSIGMPLDMASLIATDTVTKEVVAYGFTKENGGYNLRLSPQKIYRVEINYMGMKPIDFVLKTPKTAPKIVRNFIMRLDNQLGEVTVSYKIPIKVKGDTIVYNTDRFKTGTERKLGEVLNKLPGVSVNKKGQIKVNGKPVQKLMIDGKNFFQGDTKLATKNIPADVVAQVEVLRNFSEVTQMRGLGNQQDNVAMNIKLKKDGKKGFWFGYIGGGGGNLKRYLVNPKVFYYSPKYSMSLMTSFNNLGKVPFTWEDYMRFSGGVNAMSGSLNLDKGMSFLVDRNDYASSITSKFVAGNITYNPNKKLALSGFVIGADNRVDTDSHQDVSFVGGGNSRTDKENKQISKLGIVKLGMRYKPDYTKTFNYDFFGKVSDNGYETLSNRVINSQPNERITDKTNVRPQHFSQKIDYYKLMGTKHLLALKAGHSFHDQDPFYSAQLKQFSFANLLRLKSRDKFDITQKKRVKTHSFDVKADYYYIINPTSNFNVFGGTNINAQNFNSAIFELLGGKSVPVANANIAQVDFRLFDFYTGTRYKFLKGMFTFTPGFSVHMYRAKNMQLGTTVSQNLTTVLPEFGVNIQLMSSESLRLQYRQKINFTDIGKLVKGYVLSSYSNIYTGNRDLEYARNHSVSLTYHSFKMFNFTNIIASLTFDKRMNPVKGSTKFADPTRPVDWVSTSVNSAFADENINAYGRYEKTFRKFKLIVETNLSYALSNNLVQSQTGTQTNNEAKTFKQNYIFEFETHFKNLPNLTFMYDIDLSRYEQRGRVTRFITHMPSIEVDYDFLDAFRFNTGYNYTHFSDEHQVLNKYAMWNANLSYRQENTPWEVMLEVTNLLNIQNINKTSNSDISFSVNSFVVQPRYVLLSLRYHL